MELKTVIRAFSYPNTSGWGKYMLQLVQYRVGGVTYLYNIRFITSCLCTQMVRLTLEFLDSPERWGQAHTHEHSHATSKKN